ncbi:MAG: beta-galactosidase [Planctomycetia bacterium]|nr:beta-galactosidase [Planctomycetia bacterium]
MKTTWKKYFGSLVFLGLFLGVAQAQNIQAQNIVVQPQDTGAVLLNPQMGWTMHFYSNVPRNYGSDLEPSDSLEWFEGCTTVYLRIPWAYLEPEEGKFNWALLDTPAQRWIAAGKKVAFRFTTSESWLEYATPKWVFDAGAKGLRYTFG